MASKDLQPLQLFADEAGSIAVGWAAPGVVYARLQGELSANVGAAFAERLRAYTRQVAALRYFSDGSALKSYDLLARSAFVRAVLAERRRFDAIVMLCRPGEASAETKALAAALGEPLETLSDPRPFHELLSRAAPMSGAQLDPRAWIRVDVPPRPQERRTFSAYTKHVR